MENLLVAWLLPGGRAGGRGEDGAAINLDRGVPGDRVKWRETGRRGRTIEGVVEQVTSPSPDRQEPECAWVSECGGCDLAEMRTEPRRSALAKVVQRAFGVTEAPEVIPSPRDVGHRARIKLAIEKGRIGYRAAASHTLVPINVCRVARPEIGVALDRIRALLGEDTTGLATVEIRSDGTKVVASFSSEGPISAATRAAMIAFGDSALDGRTLAGDPQLRVSVLGHRLRASPLSFYQVNLEANQLLAQMVVEATHGAERVLDLYAGIGNLSIPIAASGVPVTAVEMEGQATSDLEFNAKEAGLSVQVITSRVEKFDPRRIAFDTVILDPPRTGAPGVIESVLSNRPLRIVYVACNPVTGARDIRPALAAGYRLKSLRGFDLFPDTHHVETVAVLERGR